MGILVVALLLLLFATSFAMRKSSPATSAPPAGPLGADEEAEIRGILMRDGKIAAIKRHRELTGSGLKAAKDAVDALESRPA
jgi:ribosomal protein L7/L12